ncbi:MAG: HprK-related kinase A, partial [Dechloromonas sp.]|nr:HprK-related kinase A [Dechloromonas sp.]
MLTVQDFSGRDLDEAMRQGRFRLDIGRLRVKVTSAIPDFPQALRTLYGRHPCAVNGGEYDFDITIAPPNWLRRYLARNVVFELSGERPFLPVAAGHAHALFEWGLNWTIGSFAHNYLILHSAVLETRGAGVLLSAVSGSGKSTLAAELALSGWRLLSDELALLDENLELIPCVRPVSLKNSSIDLIQSRHPEAVFGPPATNTHKGSIAHLPAPGDSVRRGSENATPRLIVFPKWTDGASLGIRAVGQGQAVMRLIDQSFNYSTLGASGFERLAGLVRSAEAWEIEYSSLDEARDALN